MNIGIDIDGVLTDVIRYACDYGSKYFFEKYGKLGININAWSLKDMFNVTDEEDKKCWSTIVENYSINEPARPFASEIINKFAESELSCDEAKIILDRVESVLGEFSIIQKQEEK